MNEFVYVVETQIVVDKKPVAGLWEFVSVHATSVGATTMAASIDSAYLKVGVKKPVRVRPMELLE